MNPFSSRSSNSRSWTLRVSMSSFAGVASPPSFGRSAARPRAVHVAASRTPHKQRSLATPDHPESPCRMTCPERTEVAAKSSAILPDRTAKWAIGCVKSRARSKRLKAGHSPPPPRRHIPCVALHSSFVLRHSFRHPSFDIRHFPRGPIPLWTSPVHLCTISPQTMWHGAFESDELAGCKKTCCRRDETSLQ